MNRDLKKLKGIVIHRAEPPDYTKNREYHFIVLKDGTCYRLNPDEVKAPHAKDFNSVTLGIAVFGDFASAEPGRNFTPTEAQYASVIAQCEAWRKLYGPLWIKGHSELGPKGTDVPSKLSFSPDHSCPGTRFDLERVRSAVQALGNDAPDPAVEAGGSIRA